MEYLFFLLSFLGIYLFGGRKIAVPYGILVLNNIPYVILITTMLDILQIFFYYFLFSVIAEKIKPIRKFRKRQEKKIERYKTWRLAQKYGKIGVFVLALLPSFGGGVWTSVLLAVVLRIDKKLLFLLIGLGSLLGIALLAFSSYGLIAFFR